MDTYDNEYELACQLSGESTDYSYVDDDTTFKKVKIILMQALPSSGATFIGCAT
jgi:hypothetical protein